MSDSHREQQDHQEQDERRTDRRGERPDVSSLLRALREEAGRTDRMAQLYEAGDTNTIQRIRRQVADLAGTERIKPEVGEMVDRLRVHLRQMGSEVRFRAVGTVQNVGNGVATLSGLPQARTDELVTFPTGVQGLILNLERHHVDVLLLGPVEGIQGGDLVTGTGQRLRVPVGQQLLGRVVNPLGQPLDGRGPVEGSDRWFLERDAPQIVERVPVEEPMMTGWKMVDALIPIGRGQRELILGDRQTGKTTLAVNAIINQRDTNVACVYVAVGQKKSTTLGVIETLRRFDAMSYTTVVISGPDDPPALRYLAPYAGCTMGELLMYEGRDVLIVYDDLSKHADAYRELSLLLRRPPGREAYPGDIFYLHSRLLERAAKLNEEAGGGSMTALPIVETQQGNVSAYIPTNLISITDGQILLDRGLFNRGIKPALDTGRSVSRVGGKAQAPAMKAVAANLRLELSQFEEVERFTRFGTELEESTRQQIQRGQRLRRILTQRIHHPLSLAEQVVTLWVAMEGYLDDIDLEDVLHFGQTFRERFEREHPALFHQLDRQGELTDEMRDALTKTAENFRADWFGGRI